MQNKIWYCWFLLFVGVLPVTLTSLYAEQSFKDEVEEECTLRSDLLVTPHIHWCKPSAQGTVKALFIGPGHETAAR